MDSNTIRILEADSNAKGDLFGRLMEGLFLALGYDRIRLNIHKSGREIDLEGNHRTERRRVVAECKATDDPIGGGDINKFVGSLDAERRGRSEISTEGYFVSLAGFTETAIEQEALLENARVNLLAEGDVIQLLIKGKMLISKSMAMELAGRCAASLDAAFVPEQDCTLLAHEMGWLWLIYFTRNMERTHFALVYADGQLIGSELAKKITTSDKPMGGDLHKLIYLAPPKDNRISGADVAHARESYEAYLARECGEIQLEGLPADEETGSRRLKLENIFVPLFLRDLPENTQAVAEAPRAKDKLDIPPSTSKQGAAVETGSQENKRLAVGAVLSKHPRLAILGPPGGGKSTLLKRLAVAYASPNRRLLIRDHLPKRTWLPMLIRCRHLDRLARRPISEILEDIPVRAEMAPELREPFNLLVRRALSSGEVLILVDGLDEIANEGNRLCFVNQLRTFLSTYPNVAIVITSREAGFRVIGSALSMHCTHYQLAEFGEEDIKKLTLTWHRLVVGDTSKVRKDANNLATAICRTGRVRQLAQNPLLLTTLLLVQRWVGQLPTKRSVLYAKAIEVLLMTWNVEAHQPLDQDEALPQLEFLAISMMIDGIQRISLRQLGEVLATARQQMPESLAYARMSVTDFIKRVEQRSSLLMVSGHEIEQGALSPMYEFRHLTFQEYLAARAVVFGHYPNRRETDDFVNVLRPRIDDVGWKEVIPLAAVLAGRQCQPLISELIGNCGDCAAGTDAAEPFFDPDQEDPIACRLLATCLSDEAQVHPDLLLDAVRCVVETLRNHELMHRLAESKYGALFNETARGALAEGKNLLTLGGFLASLTGEEFGFRESSPLKGTTADKISGLMAESGPVNLAIGCLAAMHIAYTRSTSGYQPNNKGPRYRKDNLLRGDRHVLECWLTKVLELVKSNSEVVQFAASWAAVWLMDALQWSPEKDPGALVDLASIWRRFDDREWSYIPAWALVSMPILNRKTQPLAELSVGLPGFIANQVTQNNLFKKWAAFVLAYYIKAPWGDEELAHRVASEDSKYSSVPQYRERLLAALKQEGIMPKQASADPPTK